MPYKDVEKADVYRRAYRDAHKAEKAAYDKEYAAAHRKQRLMKKLAKLYGIPEENYDRFLQDQGGACAICGRTQSQNRWLCVDHDHVTGRVRGLLCAGCNTLLGNAHDDPLLLDRAIGYLAEAS